MMKFHYIAERKYFFKIKILFLGSMQLYTQFLENKLLIDNILFFTVFLGGIRWDTVPNAYSVLNKCLLNQLCGNKKKVNDFIKPCQE